MNASMQKILAIAAITLVYGCSDYFMPWDALSSPDYSVAPGAYTVTAVPLAIGDSVTGVVSETPWFSFGAVADTLYTVTFKALYNTALEIIDSAAGTTVVSVFDSAGAAQPPVFWTCRNSGRYLLHLRQPVSLDAGDTFRIAVNTFGGAYGSITDAWEPDSVKTLGAECSFTTTGSRAAYVFRRLAPGDTDWFFFFPNKSRTYTVRTVGTTDTKIGIISSDGVTVVASDDNSGGGSNASVTWASPYSLSILKYYFFVTGGTSSAAGAYGVSIKEN